MMKQPENWWAQQADAYVQNRMGQSNGWTTASNIRRAASTTNGIVGDLTMASPTAAGFTKVTGGVLTGVAFVLPIDRKILDKNYKWSEFGFDESSTLAAFEIGLKLSASSGGLAGVGLWYAKLFGSYYGDLFTGKDSQ